MADKNASQAQQTPPSPASAGAAATGTFPFGFALPAFPGMPGVPAMPGFAEVAAFWKQAAGDQTGRVQAMVDEVVKTEEKSHAEARRAIEELSRLSLASLDYAREMSAQLRKAALETVKRAGEATAAAMPKA